MQTSFKNASVHENASESWNGLSNKLSDSEKGDESVNNIKTEAGVEVGSVSTGNFYQVNDSVSACNYDTLSLSVALVRERTIPTERPPPVGEDSANFCG